MNFPSLLNISNVRLFFINNYAPIVSDKTKTVLKNVLCFGDWLLLVLIADHLDIKIFSDILQEIKKVHWEGKRHSSLSTTIDVIGASDTDGETEDKDLLKPGQTPVFLTPNSMRKVHPPIIKKVKR